MRLTSTFAAVVKLFSLLLFLGVAFANTVFVSVSLAVVLLVLGGMFVRQPGGITVKRTKTNDTVFAGEVFSNAVEVSVGSGIGVVVIYDKIPSNVELVGGSNVKYIWKGLKPKTVEIFYSVKCAAAGTYHFDCLFLEARHFLRFREPLRETYQVLQVLEVKPRIADLKKLRNTAAVSRIPLPLGAMSKMGLPTLEFKELRQYSSGDPFKFINWKATARNVCRGSTQPVINEYEKEGRKVVWIFLDNSPAMRVGTNIKNVFSCSLEAVSGLAEYYLKQNNIVALCAYNRGHHFIHPGAGKKQHYKILKSILRLNVVAGGPEQAGGEAPIPALSLRETVVRYKKYLAGSRPLCVIVTRLTGANAGELSAGIREMSKYTGLARGKLTIMVVNISGYGLLSLERPFAAGAEFLESRADFLARKMKSGVIWVDWDPAKSGFAQALLEQVVKR